MLGALFFAAALTPTLIPRSYLTQGALARGCFAIGYFAGVLWRRLSMIGRRKRWRSSRAILLPGHDRHLARILIAADRVPYSAISTGCAVEGPASGRSSIMIKQSEAVVISAVAAAKT